MEVGSGLALVAGIFASKDVVSKVLGPTADYIGGEFKNLVDRCNVNLSDVMASSLRKGAERSAGAVDPRTAKSILEDAAYCDDILVKDYYGGILCGAKSDDQDDTALPYVSILKGLSRSQVKTHFLVYALLHTRLSGSLKSVTLEEERNRVRLAIDLERYLNYLGKELSTGEATINHVVNGLIRADLLGTFFRYGDPTYIRQLAPEFDKDVPSLLVCPSLLGIELFLWAAGIRNPNPNLILDANLNLMSKFPEDLQRIVSD